LVGKIADEHDKRVLEAENAYNELLFKTLQSLKVAHDNLTSKG